MSPHGHVQALKGRADPLSRSRQLQMQAHSSSWTLQPCVAITISSAQVSSPTHEASKISQTIYAPSDVCENAISPTSCRYALEWRR